MRSQYGGIEAIGLYEDKIVIELNNVAKVKLRTEADISITFDPGDSKFQTAVRQLVAIAKSEGIAVSK